MILGGPQFTDHASFLRGTLDDLFRQAALRRPTAWALVDAPNRAAYADGVPRYLSYAAADRMVSAIAGRLHRLGFARDSVIALQFPNMIEGVLTLLGVLRAGMIAAPLPLLWRQDEMVPALARIGARAIIAGGRAGDTKLCDVAMQVASELFSIRYVCGFGAGLADGVIALDELFQADRLDPLVPLENRNKPAAHLALITWETTTRGHVPVARNHAEMIAGGLAVQLEGRIEQDSCILASPAFGSFAGFALTMMPWLLTSGTLALHAPFNPKILAAQCAELHCDTVALPGPLLPQLADAGMFDQLDLRNVLAVWRNPERMASSTRWTHTSVGLVDVQVFGETGLIPSRREAFGLPESLSPGAIKAPHHAEDATFAADIARNGSGTLVLRGPMVSCKPFPPDVADSDSPCFEADAAGYVDTGYPCRIDRDSGELELRGAPAGLVSVGGYRFTQRGLQDKVSEAEQAATITALPDSILSHRLAGSANDRSAVQKKLNARGINPLVAGAFRERRKPQAA